MNAIIRRMDEIRKMLINPHNLDLSIRPELHREYRDLETRLKEMHKVIEVIYLPESKVLLYKVNGTLRGGFSGPMAEEKYRLIREFIEVTVKSKENV